jgi:hypothetical protein
MAVAETATNQFLALTPELLESLSARAERGELE